LPVFARRISEKAGIANVLPPDNGEATGIYHVVFEESKDDKGIIRLDLGRLHTVQWEIDLFGSASTASPRFW
jgi:hypothetical protein